MKKLSVLLVAFLTVFTLNASETEVKKVISDFFQATADMNGAGIMKLLHAEFTEEDASGVSSYAEMKQACADLDAMRKVFDKATAPGATLQDVISALFAIAGETMDKDNPDIIRKIENTAEGKKLLKESVAAVMEMKKIYRQKTEKERDSVKIISVKIDGTNARAIFTVQTEGKTEYNIWDMVKVDGRWLLKKAKSTTDPAAVND